MDAVQSPHKNGFQSTPSARRATDRACKLLCNIPISIHALREEGDPFRFQAACQTGNFNPRPPRGGRHALKERPFPVIEFQSTPSARRATVTDDTSTTTTVFQSTPSARRATGHFVAYIPASWISIHALREESDLDQAYRLTLLELFQSTPSARRATRASTL